MTTVSLDNAEILCFSMFLNNVAEVLDCNAGFDMSDGFLEAFAGGLDEANIVRISPGFVSYVVSLVEITVITLMEERYVNIENVTVLQHSLVGDAVADNFIDRSAYGFGEMVVIQRRRVRLEIVVRMGASWVCSAVGLTFRSMHALWTTSSM